MKQKIYFIVFFAEKDVFLYPHLAKKRKRVFVAGFFGAILRKIF
jgi:hypothetical protein